MDCCNNSLCDYYFEYDGWLSNQLEETYRTLRATQQTINIILTTFLATVFLIGSAGNILVLMVFAKSKSKKSATVFIIALATNDLIICLVVLPGVLMKEWYIPFRWDALCRGWELVRCATIPLSSLILMIVAVDRYILICCVGHCKAISTKHARWILIGIILCSVGLGIPPMLRVGVYQQGSSPTDPHQYLGLCISNDFLLNKHAADHYWQAMAAKFFLVLVTVVILYSKIFHTVYRQGKLRPGKNQSCPSAWNNSVARTKKCILTKNLGPGIHKEDLKPQTFLGEATREHCLTDMPKASSLFLSTPLEPSKLLQKEMTIDQVPQTIVTADVKEVKGQARLETHPAMKDTPEVKAEMKQRLCQTHISESGSCNNKITSRREHIRIRQLVGLRIDEQQNQINSSSTVNTSGHLKSIHNLVSQTAAITDDNIAEHPRNDILVSQTAAVTNGNNISHQTINSYSSFNQPILNNLTSREINNPDRQIKVENINQIINQCENDTINPDTCIDQCENDTINPNTCIDQCENDTINPNTCIDQCENDTINPDTCTDQCENNSRVTLKINSRKNLISRSNCRLNQENVSSTSSQRDHQQKNLPHLTGLSIKSDQSQTWKTKICCQSNIKLFKNLKFLCKSKVHPLDEQSCGKTQTPGEYVTERTKKHSPQPQYHINDTRQKRIWSAQVKTAKVLLLVTVVYILSFAPALLMTVDAVPSHKIPFYAYFIHSAANPIIYSFINKPFRNQLAESIRCKQYT